MAWPVTRLDTFKPNSAAWNELVNSFSTWGGNVNAGGYNLSNLGTLGLSTVNAITGSFLSGSAVLNTSFTLGRVTADGTFAAIGVAANYAGNSLVGDIVIRQEDVTKRILILGGSGAEAVRILGTQFISTCPAAAPADANMGNSQVTMWVNEAGNNLTFRVKYSSGTVKAGTVALA